MHELRIAKDLSEIVLGTASEQKVSSVSRVNIVFGQLIQVVPEIFETAFRECVRGTPAANAELIFEILPVRVVCRECRREFAIENNTFTCSNCSSSEMDIIQGKEMFVKSIETEELWK